MSGRNLGKKDSRGGNYWGSVSGFGCKVFGGREELEGSGSVATWGNECLQPGVCGCIILPGIVHARCGEFLFQKLPEVMSLMRKGVLRENSPGNWRVLGNQGW